MLKIGLTVASFLMLVLAQGGLAPAGSGWLAAAAQAATGDTLIVTADGVNVRYQPTLDAKVRMRVYRDQLATEIERQGDWVRVEIAGADGIEGWIHALLLATPTPEALARARRRATQPPEAGLPEAKPPVPPSAINLVPAEPAPTAAQPVPSGASEPARAAPVPPVPPAPAAPAAPVAPAAPTAKPAAGAGASLPPPVVAGTGAAAASATAATDPTALGGQGTKAPAQAAAASEPPAIEPAAGPVEATDAADLARFRDSVDYLNSRSASVADVDLFEGVKAVGEGVVQVGATEAWSTIPPGSQQSYANTLLDRWAAARGYKGPVAVQIVDPDGKVLLESKKP